MKLNRKATNAMIAGFLAVVVLTVGFFAYQQKASADTILPGFATAHIALRVTTPTAQSIKFRVVFNPTNGTKRYYFKERTFDFPTPGMNSVEWYIRKLPEGTFSIEVAADGSTLLPSPITATLITDKVNETSKFEHNLGMPPAPSATPTPELTLEATDTETADTSADLYGIEPATGSDSVIVPPVPQLPTN